MPNTPAQIGRGMTVWTATESVSEKQKTIVRSILGSMGKEIWVDDEGCIDMATAVSGSGPAYVFLFMESLINAAKEIGLSPEKAHELVFQTVTGAALFAAHSGKDLAELRRMVTSPGGTTAEAIKVFEAEGLEGTIKRAVSAAYEKAKQLGGAKK
jgi:pyrroline-5-carboxylate reductase